MCLKTQGITVCMCISLCSKKCNLCYCGNNQVLQSLQASYAKGMKTITGTAECLLQSEDQPMVLMCVVKSSNSGHSD